MPALASPRRVSLGLAALAAVLLLTQSPNPPQPQPQPPGEHLRLHLQVVDAETDQGLPQARVWLEGAAQHLPASSDELGTLWLELPCCPEPRYLRVARQGYREARLAVPAEGGERRLALEPLAAD